MLGVLFVFSVDSVDGNLVKKLLGNVVLSLTCKRGELERLANVAQLNAVAECSGDTSVIRKTCVRSASVSVLGGSDLVCEVLCCDLYVFKLLIGKLNAALVCNLAEYEHLLNGSDSLIHEVLVPGLAVVLCGNEDRVVLTLTDGLLVKRETAVAVGRVVKRAVGSECLVVCSRHEGAVSRLIEIAHHGLVDSVVFGLHSGAHSSDNTGRADERSKTSAYNDEGNESYDERKQPGGHTAVGLFLVVRNLHFSHFRVHLCFLFFCFYIVSDNTLTYYTMLQ